MRQISEERKIKMVKGLYWFVLLSFIIPIAFLVYKIIVTRHVDISDADYRSRADYILMLVECLLGIVVIHVPTFLARKFRFELPIPLYIMFMIFLYCAIFLGEVRNFYYVVPHWDVILHCFSSMMAGTFGFMVVSILNRDEHTSLNLSPLFVALFAFCFAVSIGCLWEIYEFAFDGVLGLNMQKFILEDGTVLIGREALSDTMEDIIVDCIGALVASVVGYLSIMKDKGWISDKKEREYSEAHV